jgi:hypothetical protein
MIPMISTVGMGYSFMSIAFCGFDERAVRTNSKSIAGTVPRLFCSLMAARIASTAPRGIAGTALIAGTPPMGQERSMPSEYRFS